MLYEKCTTQIGHCSKNINLYQFFITYNSVVVSYAHSNKRGVGFPKEADPQNGSTESVVIAVTLLEQRKDLLDDMRWPADGRNRFLRHGVAVDVNHHAAGSFDTAAPNEDVDSRKRILRKRQNHSCHFANGLNGSWVRRSSSCRQSRRLGSFRSA